MFKMLKVPNGGRENLKISKQEGILIKRVRRNGSYDGINLGQQ